MKVPAEILHLPIVALTGNIGSGKSEVARIFKQLGACLIDADQLAREAVRPGSNALEQIRLTFGASVLQDNGSLNRKALGNLIFQDEQKRSQLEKIIHPEVRRLYFERLMALATSTSPDEVIVYVVPLYFESGIEYAETKVVVVVSAPEEQCIQRVVTRDSCSLELARTKYHSQIPIEEKRRKADVVIENSGSLDDLVTNSQAAYSRIRTLLVEKTK